MAVATLNDVVDILKEQNNTLNELKDQGKKNTLQDLENRREKARGGKSKSGDKTVATVVKGAEDTSLALMGLVAAVVAIGRGFVSSALKSIKDFYATVFKGFTRLFNGIIKLFKIDVLLARFGVLISRIVDPIMGLFRSIRGFFSSAALKITDSIGGGLKIVDNFRANFLTGFRNFGKVLTGAVPDVLKFEDFSTFAGRFGAGVRAVMNAVLGPLMSAENIADMGKVADSIMEPIRGVIASVKKFFTAEGPIGRIFTMVKSAFGFAEEGSKFMGVLGSVGRILGRLFYPLTIIMSIWDTVKGAIEGFEQDGFLGGIAGAINGLLGSLIGAPLDLLKDGISWILSKFGFEDASKFLDKFSFTDLIKKAVYGLINGFIEGIAVILDKMPLVPGFVADKVRGFKLSGGAAPAGGETESADPAPQPPPEPAKRVTPKAEEKPNDDLSRITKPEPEVDPRIKKSQERVARLEELVPRMERQLKMGGASDEFISNHRGMNRAKATLEKERAKLELLQEQAKLDVNRAASTGAGTVAVGGGNNSGNNSNNITNINSGGSGQRSATNLGVSHLPAT
jgi:hypothetical protein